MKNELNNVQHQINEMLMNMRADSDMDKKLVNYMQHHFDIAFIVGFRAFSKKRNKLHYENTDKEAYKEAYKDADNERSGNW